MSGNPCFVGTTQFPEVRFTLVGLVASPEFQECLTIIELLHKTYPDRYPKPFIRPMLEFDWIEYLTRAQRTFGGKLWHLEKPFIVFANEKQLGCDQELENYVSQWFHIHIERDYQCLAQRGVVDMYEKYMELGRTFAFVSLSKNHKSFGNMIFMLYSDIVPKTCRNFIKKCKSRKNGYRGTRIHRIMTRSWIQCGDFTLPVKSMSSENYVVPHNRRGILSMCNNGPHIDNKTQFFITLESTPWMDYRYVAFGQLMQGEYVLRELEQLPTIRESLTDEVIVYNCGEISLDDTAIAKNITKVHKYIDDRSSKSSFDRIDLRDAPSIILEEHYINLLYTYFNDNETHLPMKNLPSYLLSEPSLISFIRSYKIEMGEMEEDGFGKDIDLSSDHIFYKQIKDLISSQAIDYLNSLSKQSGMDPSSYVFLQDDLMSEHEHDTETRLIEHAHTRKSTLSNKSIKSEKSKSKVGFMAPPET